jgi:hypothetical protein
MPSAETGPNFQGGAQCPTCIRLSLELDRLRALIQERGPVQSPYNRAFTRREQSLIRWPRPSDPGSSRPTITLRGRGGRRKQIEAELARLGFQKPKGRPRRIHMPDDGWEERAVAVVLRETFLHWWRVPESHGVGLSGAILQAWKDSRKVRRATSPAEFTKLLLQAVPVTLGRLVGTSPRTAERILQEYDFLEARYAVLDRGPDITCRGSAIRELGFQASGISSKGLDAEAKRRLRK